MVEEARKDFSIQPLEANELGEADRIFRRAFGKFLNLSDPLTFMGDAGYIHARWRADPASAYAARIGNDLMGSNFAIRYGSVGFFGPLSVRPEVWGKGIGLALVEQALERFAEWEIEHAGLFTWSNSPKHIHLYQKFGFWARFLTVIMSKPVGVKTTEESHEFARWWRFSRLSKAEREESLKACGEVTGNIYGGLDVSGEIRAVFDQNLGDTVLLWDDSGLAGFAVCHCGPGTEAGSDVCYIKFGAARPGSTAAYNFERLLGACEALAAIKGLRLLIAGMNMGRHEAYRALLGRKFHIELQGISMHRPNTPGYDQPDTYVIDDWR